MFEQTFTKAFSVLLCLLSCWCIYEVMAHQCWEPRFWGWSEVTWPTSMYILYTHWCLILNVYVYKHPHMFDVKEVLGGIHENKFPQCLTFQFSHTLCLTLSGIMQPLGLLEVAAQSSSVLLTLAAVCSQFAHHLAWQIFYFPVVICLLF